MTVDTRRLALGSCPDSWGVWFADDPRHVPFTNNCGERALRPVKTQLKISGCHQSADGATAWLAVRSYLDSARKHGLSAFQAIHRAFTGNLWMPPIAQPA